MAERVAGRRLWVEQPGVTRLLDRLEAKGLVRRQRCAEDRRIVHCWISAAGLALLAEMDEPIRRADQRLLSGLGEQEQRQLVELLDRVRGGGSPA